ncbi:contactin-associated protein-like 5 [Parus major]|uniref:contactin-associated protein-like 5 n=1 Tax=Parus major TaxID=9157 RepID=UPI0007714B38|nr:contactin-associated protein-like 5 [Parus major]
MDSRALGGFTLLLFTLWHLGLAATNYNCDDALVSPLPSAALTSSSELFSTHSPSFAKLNRRDGAGGWSPLESNEQQWLQVDLGDRVEVVAVATQGRYGSSDWVTSYALMFSDTGRNWRQYRQDDSVWVFTGNSNADSVVHHKLLHSMKARFLRFIPLKWNAGGRIGLRVEVFGCSYKSDIADFDGRSSLLYRFNQKLMSTFKDVVSLKFKSMQGDGVLFHGEGQRGDYITLELQKGKLSLHLNLGDSNLHFSNSHTSVTLGSLLDDQHWHSVLIERFNKQVNFTVDKHTQHFRTKGDSDHLDIDYELSFGGIPVPGKPGTFQRKNFHGCIENLYYNGVNIIDLAKRRKPQIYTVGNVTFSCSEPQVVPITFVSASRSYLLLPGTAQIDGLSVSFQFRTWNKDGLLLFTELSENSGHLLVYLHGGRLMLFIQKETENPVEITEGTNLHDGLWHSVNINARRHRITLTLDNDAATASHATTVSRIYSGNSYYFGGCPDNFTDSQCLNPITAFQGCMRLIFIDNQPKDLILVQQGSLGNFSDLHIDLCGIKDRCLPNYCEHGGRCSQSWTTFYCDCNNTGYTGATCHNSVYEQSCEAYRHQGKTSGFFYIDSDGSGPLGPLRVFCNITEDKIWTAVQHNSTGLTRVQGAGPENPYTMSFNYNSSAEQLEAVINSAEYCEQEASYHCKKSRLLNTPNGMPFAWWVGRANEKHLYWGGSLPGIQQCACGLEESCLDMRYFCNCDADREEWTNDTGLLAFKDHLPVTQIVITDTNRSNSEAAWKIGPLRCYGDRQFWNAASFNTEASYLHFPTLHAEVSADISFFFKTTAVAGVFLENLGIKDFIRIEISSPKEITFSIDVGNGPTEATVQSPTPLNDNQWHYVRAERNLKQTSLQVDSLPKKVLQAPAEGHFRLQLNSQLFVGGTASRQKGFLGCIRSLHLNGQKLDLEERAKMTPGVKPGCPGHCSSYGNLCHNGGKCVEKYTGYFCDCTNSAYEGPYCKEEVSALFEAGTSVTYTFQEPYPVTKNASTSSSAIYVDAVMSKENIAFSFLTAHTPSLLLYINTYFHEYLAVILSKNGSLQVRYKLSKDGLLIFTIDSGNFANRELHHVKINREGRELIIQVDQVLKLKHNFSEIDFKAIKSLTLGKVTDSLSLDPEVSKANAYGFTGCLSSVQYNHIAPLKAALRHPSVAPVTVRGSLTESSCASMLEADVNTATTIYSSSDPFGKTDEREPLTNAVRSDSAVIGGVIAVVIFIIFCIIAIMSRFLYQHKQAHRNSQKKEKEYPENLESSFKADIDLQNTVSECKREYFI